MSIEEKGKTKTAVSGAEVGEIKALAMILKMMHGHGAATVRETSKFLEKTQSTGYYTVQIQFCVPVDTGTNYAVKSYDKCSVFTKIDRRIELVQHTHAW